MMAVTREVVPSSSKRFQLFPICLLVLGVELCLPPPRRKFQGGFQSNSFNGITSVFASMVPTKVARRSYAEALVGSGQTLAIATLFRGNLDFSVGRELRGRSVSSKEVPEVIISRNPIIEAGSVSTTDPKGVSGINLDFCSLRNMLVR